MVFESKTGDPTYFLAISHPFENKICFHKEFFIGPIIALPFQSVSRALVKFAQGSEVEFMQPIQKARNLALYVT